MTRQSQKLQKNPPFFLPDNPITLQNPPNFFYYADQKKFVYRCVCYRQAETLGCGTFGKVVRFTAENININPMITPAQVVVKTERPNATRTQGLFTEARGFSQEAHWNQHVYGFGVFSGNKQSTDTAHYIMMHFFEGQPVHKIKILEFKELVKIFIIVLTAFDTLHQQKRVVHGDIKGSNVLYNPSTQTCRPIDFGNMTRVDSKIGAYTVPPETDGRIKEPTEKFPQTAPELFGKKAIAAHPAQDAYGLGLLLLMMMQKFKKNHWLTQNEKEKIVSVMQPMIQELRAHEPHFRISLCAAKNKLLVEFFTQLPRSPRVSQQAAHPQEKQAKHTSTVTGVLRLPSLLAPQKTAHAAPPPNDNSQLKPTTRQQSWRH